MSLQSAIRTIAPWRSMDFVVIGADDTDRMMVELHNNLCIKGLPIPNDVARSIINDLIGVLEEASLNRLCPMVDD